MVTLITVLIVVASIVLILVVLVQKSKGGGLSSNFSSSNAIMGVRKTTDFVEKATWGLAGFVIVMSIVCVMVRPKTVSNSGKGIIPENPINNQALPPDFSTELPVAPAPSIPAPATEQTAPTPTPEAN